MASYTNNLNIKKPNTNENYDVVSAYNDAMDKIDASVGLVNAELATKSKQSDLDNLSNIFDSKLDTKITNGQARVNTSVMPINFSEMDTPTRALFTGGAVPIVGINSVGSENIKNGAVDLISTDKTVRELIGFSDSPLTWQFGSPEAGIINPNRENAVCSTQLLDLTNGAIVKVRSGTRWWYTSHDASGVYLNNSDWISPLQNPLLEPNPTRKARIVFARDDNEVIPNMVQFLQSVYVGIPNGNGGSNPIEPSQNAIPEYWVAHLNTKINSITSLQNQGGADATSVVFITDTHISGNNQNSGALVQKIVKECDVPYIVHGGDFVTGYGTASKQSILKDIKLDREMFGDVWPRVLRAEGNHDAAYDGDAGAGLYYTKNLTEEECYNYMFRHNALHPQKNVGGNKSYFFQDDTVNKIRTIMLNSSDLPAGVTGNGNSIAKYNKMQRACMRPDQINWLANIALNVPDDTWSVLVCSHIEPYSQDMNVQNGNLAAELVQAFKNKTTYTGTSKATVDTEFKLTVNANFTGKGGNVIGWLSGHMHADGLNRNRPAGINFNILETLNDSKNVWSGQPNKVTGTATEQAFDVLTINKKLRRVNVTRIGAGTDRLFTY